MADVIQNTKGQIYANYGQICRLRHGAAPVSLSLHVLGLCLSWRSLEGSAGGEGCMGMYISKPIPSNWDHL